MPPTISDAIHHSGYKSKMSTILGGVHYDEHKREEATVSRLGQELRSVRLALGMSLKTVAEPSGISAAYLQKIEAGEVQSPSPNVLHRLSRTLNVPYAGLMEYAGYVVPNKDEAPASPMSFALSAADLSAAERRAVAAFIAHLRDQREIGRRSEAGDD